jgi:hypothetical protein
MVQIPGVNGGYTTLDQHEYLTWGPAVASAAALIPPLTTSTTSIATFIKQIRDRRKDN